MPKFIVQQYEIHVYSYEVKASNKGEAIAKLFQGDYENILGQDSEFSEVADQWGMPSKELLEEEKDSLEESGIFVSKLIPSIRSVKQIEDSE